jgi:hypothetical protein
MTNGIVLSVLMLSIVLRSDMTNGIMQSGLITVIFNVIAPKILMLRNTSFLYSITV